MSESIVDVSRGFFYDVLKPILESNFPAATAQTTFGVFGYGSEVLRLDDEHSADHHWGIRVNALMPEALFAQQAADILRIVEQELPASYRGHNLRDGYSSGKGLSLISLEGYLRRTVGLTRVPVTHAEWLSVPEEDITHIINGEIWQDETGRFSAIRARLPDLLPGAGAAAAYCTLVSLFLRHGHLCAQARPAARQRVVRRGHVCKGRPPGRATGLLTGQAVLPL